MAADDRLSGARNLGVLNGIKTVRDSVGLKDRNDYYAFTLNGRSSFNLVLNKLKNNVDVALIQGGRTLFSSTRRGRKSESIATTLDAGTYYIRVYPKGGKSRYRLKLATTALPIGAPPVPVERTVYFNDQNMSIALGPTMSANPFENRSAASSLASVIDVPSATESELHNQSTHVWVSNGVLELSFDLRVDTDLTALHFWNYHSEDYDVDNIDFKFYDSNNNLIGILPNYTPTVGGSAPSDATPIFAQSFPLSFPSKVRYVNAVLSGSNGQVDFNNLGFTGKILSPS
jgi:Bacterial pre-peptidase C-terminal domain